MKAGAHCQSGQRPDRAILAVQGGLGWPVQVADLEG